MKDFVPIKRSLVTTLSETPPLTSKKYVAEDTKNNPKQPELDELLFSHSSFFALEFQDQKFKVNINQNKLKAFEINDKNRNYLVPSPPFLLQNNSLKNAKFLGFF